MSDGDPDSGGEDENQVPESVYQEAEGTFQNFQEWVSSEIEADGE